MVKLIDQSWVRTKHPAEEYPQILRFQFQQLQFLHCRFLQKSSAISFIHTCYRSIPMKNLISLVILISFIPISIQSKVSISFSPSILNNSGDPVEIRWSGVESPSKLDWLGIYSPPNSSHKHFIGYVFLSSSPGWQSGSGSVSIPLVNLRSNYSFRIFRWIESEIDDKHHDHDHNPLPGTAHLLAASEVLRFSSNRGPEQIHLAFTDHDEEMRVMFVTEDGSERYVRYGEDMEKLDQIVVASVGRYEREHMCDSPANDSLGWRDPGFIHDAVMKNLQKGARVYYQVIFLILPNLGFCNFCWNLLCCCFWIFVSDQLV